MNSDFFLLFLVIVPMCGAYHLWSDTYTRLQMIANTYTKPNMDYDLVL